VPILFHNRLMRGEVPISYVVIQTHLGYRAYAEKELKGVFSLLGYIADGSYLADGSITAGSASAGIIEKSGRVLNFGSFERTLQSKKDDVLAAYSGKQIQHISMNMDNSDRYFSQLIAKEPFIGRPIKCYVGFENDSQSEHLSIFSGIISEMSVLPTLMIEADER
jgi:hypothetical protein